jgi:hypothetical protein
MAIIAHLGWGVKRMSNRLLRLARPITFFIGIALSLLAIYAYVAMAKIVIRDPGLVTPDASLWTASQLESALAGLGLTVNFYAVYSLGAGLVFSLVFLACGWLILLRKNQDWFGLFLALLLLSWASGNGAFTSFPPLSPWIETFYSYLSWFMWPGFFFLLYFFPSGHVTPRWTRWFALGWGLISVYGLMTTILDVSLTEFLYVIPILIAVLLVGGYAQIYRYRHAGALERQQIKWVVTALLLMVVLFVLIALLGNLTGLGDPRKSSLTGALIFQMISSAMGNIVFIGVPISIALAMLRYRLWDVDILIRRTLVYSMLTATLALVFFGGVTLLQSIFSAISNQQSEISVVISTLAIAALFNPLRKRVQDFVDRRFYRKKYNAEQTLARFAAIARDETDIEELSAELVSVVQETMQPENVTLWLKPHKGIRAGK